MGPQPADGEDVEEVGCGCEEDGGRAVLGAKSKGDRDGDRVIVAVGGEEAIVLRCVYTHLVQLTSTQAESIGKLVTYVNVFTVHVTSPYSSNSAQYLRQEFTIPLFTFHPPFPLAV